MWNEAANARERFYRAAGYPSVSEQIQHAYADTGYPGVLKFLLGEAAKSDRKQYYSDYETARMNALLGNKDQALADLKRAFNHRSGWLVFLEQEPAFDALKGEPEFQDLVRHIRR